MKCGKKCGVKKMAKSKTAQLSRFFENIFTFAFYYVAQQSHCRFLNRYYTA